MKVDCRLRNVAVAFGSRTCWLALALARALRWLLAGEDIGPLAAVLLELCASAAVEGLGAAPGGAAPRPSTAAIGEKRSDARGRDVSWADALQFLRKSVGQLLQWRGQL